MYRSNIDQILGYVHVKDLIWANPEAQLENIIRQMVFIPEGASLPRAFQVLTKAGRHMGIVLDEFSGTDGVVTLENLLEVIVGEIKDKSLQHLYAKRCEHKVPLRMISKMAYMFEW